MVREFRSEDVGKRVVSAEGHRVGTVTKVSGGAVHVKPVSGSSSPIRKKLGWAAEGRETYRLRRGAVGEIGDTKIHLRATPAV